MFSWLGCLFIWLLVVYYYSWKCYYPYQLWRITAVILHKNTGASRFQNLLFVYWIICKLSFNTFITKNVFRDIKIWKNIYFLWTVFKIIPFSFTRDHYYSMYQKLKWYLKNTCLTLDRISTYVTSENLQSIDLNNQYINFYVSTIKISNF